MVNRDHVQPSALISTATILIFQLSNLASMTVFVATFVFVRRNQASNPLLLLQDVTERVTILVLVALAAIFVVGFVKLLENVSDWAFRLVLL